MDDGARGPPGGLVRGLSGDEARVDLGGPRRRTTPATRDVGRPGRTREAARGRGSRVPHPRRRSRASPMSAARVSPRRSHEKLPANGADAAGASPGRGTRPAEQEGRAASRPSRNRPCGRRMRRFVEETIAHREQRRRRDSHVHIPRRPARIEARDRGLGERRAWPNKATAGNRRCTAIAEKSSGKARVAGSPCRMSARVPWTKTETESQLNVHRSKAPRRVRSRVSKVLSLALSKPLPRARAGGRERVGAVAEPAPAAPTRPQAGVTALAT